MYGLPLSRDEIKVEDGKVYGQVQTFLFQMAAMAGLATYDSSAAEFKVSLVWPSYNNDDPVGTIYPDVMCSKYATSSVSTNDKSCFVRKTSAAGAYEICFKDSSYTDVDDFVASLKEGDTFLISLFGNSPSELDDCHNTVFEWYGVKDNAEVKIDTLPCYVSGQGTDTLTIDAMYGDDIQVVLRAKDYRYGDSLLPMKEHSGLAWELPRLDCNVYSENGQAVRSDTEAMSFGTIVNAQNTVLTEAQKNAHLRFKWKSRPSTTATQVDRGWGQDISMSGDALRVIHVDGKMGTTVMSYETYLLGPYEALTYGNEDVTDGGAPLFGRTIE